VSCKNLSIHCWQVEQVAVGVHQVFTVAADVCNYPVWTGTGISKLLPMILFDTHQASVCTDNSSTQNSKLTYYHETQGALTGQIDCNTDWPSREISVLYVEQLHQEVSFSLQ
jgi:hypothetical protein